MTPRKPVAFLSVCAVHAALGWALLWPAATSSNPKAPDGPRLVSVLVHPALPPAVTAPLAMRAPRATPSRLTRPSPQPIFGGRSEPLAALAAFEAPAAPAAPVAAVAADAGPTWPAEVARVPFELPALPRAAATPPEPALPTTAPIPAVSSSRAEAQPLVVAQADRRHCPPAAHPAVLRERGIEGAVLLRVKVDVQGRAADVQLLAGSGWRLFDEAALQQVRGCRFVPATLGGQAIDSWVEFPVRFVLAG
jgi:protein TonB